ncbi:MAG: hypothetical protein AAF958_08265 [Planctomycetota bacterium]
MSDRTFELDPTLAAILQQVQPQSSTQDTRLAFYEMGRAAGLAEAEDSNTAPQVDRSTVTSRRKTRRRNFMLAAGFLIAVSGFFAGRLTSTSPTRIAEQSATTAVSKSKIGNRQKLASDPLLATKSSAAPATEVSSPPPYALSIVDWLPLPSRLPGQVSVIASAGASASDSFPFRTRVTETDDPSIEEHEILRPSHSRTLSIF